MNRRTFVATLVTAALPTSTHARKLTPRTPPPQPDITAPGYAEPQRLTARPPRRRR